MADQSLTDFMDTLAVKSSATSLRLIGDHSATGRGQVAVPASTPSYLAILNIINFTTSVESVCIMGHRGGQT